ncbi:MAG: twin-arginine translocation signal domain-containing protein [Pseudomonadota bacterium]
MMRTVNRRDFLVRSSGALAGAMALPAFASTPVLTVRGAIEGVDASGNRRFDLAALQAMPQSSFKTATPWQKQPAVYSGVAVGTFLSALKAKGTKLRLIALNDYAVVADIKELTGNGAILAIARDGVALPISDKGPIFVVFPFDSDAKLRTDSFYLHSVWQLCQIDVL